MTPGNGAAVAAKRLNFNISERARTELETISRESQRSMSEIIRLGIGLAKIALRAQRDGQKIIVTSSDGEPIRELVLPD